MADYPISHIAGQQCNRATWDFEEWPVRETTFEDGSRSRQFLTTRPRRVFKLSYDALDRTFGKTLVNHYLANGSTSFSFRYPPRMSTAETIDEFETVTVKYKSFKTRRMQQGIDPVMHPSFDIELIEEI